MIRFTNWFPMYGLKIGGRQPIPVRVVHLLEHTTGWDDMHLREYAKDAPGMSLRDGLDYDHHSRTSRWRPGTRMAYCNSGRSRSRLKSLKYRTTFRRFSGTESIPPHRDEDRDLPAVRPGQSNYSLP